ncbi:uncharacterized protein A1O9_07152 [Exophiala aquamarina CBS 119918]|uniref:Metallo-beta-lactamase domain-containing protein n=1 Tax=Exophiala aquamarina CBS 119918 TaxID=1182545 RepID=A0A072PB18_9EURO|nr:uncharacterized protein A1O9_07152 [Exophiala aquamarina CBS 119918]KEF56962.1 hypothetical protein A1O9_07152 [Exophiala aquamarina CBS 119918]
MAPVPAPELGIPDSSSTVDVRIIDTTGYGKVAADMMFTPPLPGHETFVFPSYSILISNHEKGKHVLFDLGMRKDWETFLPAPTVGFVKQIMPFSVASNVDEILDADAGNLGITTKSISAVIWSHHHFDHRGDLSRFDPSTELIVGPGFMRAYTPAYPTNPESSIQESELASHPVRELDDAAFTLQLGPVPAHDFFGDGSFYILSTPGHTVGHLAALARVTSNGNGSDSDAGQNPSFIFLGGDCAHYPGIFRPTTYKPLPQQIPEFPRSAFGTSPCPGIWLQNYIHPQKSATEPFLKPNPRVNEIPEKAMHSLSAMQEFDASPDVLVCIAHDGGLLGNVDFYPERLNGWRKKGVKNKVHWNFCGDFDVHAGKEKVEADNGGNA